MFLRSPREVFFPQGRPSFESSQNWNSSQISQFWGCIFRRNTLARLGGSGVSAQLLLLLVRCKPYSWPTQSLCRLWKTWRHLVWNTRLCPLLLPRHTASVYGERIPVNALCGGNPAICPLRILLASLSGWCHDYRSNSEISLSWYSRTEKDGRSSFLWAGREERTLTSAWEEWQG